MPKQLVRLRALTQYDSRNEHYAAGQVFETSEAQAAFLKRDAPGVFEEVVEPDAAPATDTKSPDGPPADKAVKSAPKKK